jgi:hypothetical protein
MRGAILPPPFHLHGVHRHRYAITFWIYSKYVFSKPQNGYLWQYWSKHHATDNGPSHYPALQYEEELHNGYIWNLLLITFHSVSLEGFFLHLQAEMPSSYGKNRCMTHVHQTLIIACYTARYRREALYCHYDNLLTVLLLWQSTDCTAVMTIYWLYCHYDNLLTVLPLWQSTDCTAVMTIYWLYCHYDNLLTVLLLWQSTDCTAIMTIYWHHVPESFFRNELNLYAFCEAKTS